VASPAPGRRLLAVIHGRVQGVGFRFHIARAAARHGITGWVANEPGGIVRAVGEGAEPELQAWLVELRRGPSGAAVSRVDEEWSAGTGTFDDFDIRSGHHGGD
jgi:acylphosphatase